MDMTRKLTHEEIQSRQKEKRKEGRLPLVVVLNNIRSAYNVGSIFRTADGAGVEKIWICGITGFPPNKEISKTALGAEYEVPWSYEEDPLTAIRNLKKAGYQIVFLEQMANSVLYQDFKPAFPVALVVGNEVGGVSEQLVAHCDVAIEIEMAGLKNSLNVSVAFGIIAYHFRNHFLA